MVNRLIAHYEELLAKRADRNFDSETIGAIDHLMTNASGVVEKVTKRIAKKVDVLKADYYTDNEIFFQEVALYKLSTPKLLADSEISRMIRHSTARVIEMNDNYTVVEMTGQTDVIVEMYDEFVARDCMLQFVKSGRVAIPRASQEALSDLLFDEDFKRKSVK